jgi:hypothetical protein
MSKKDDDELCSMYPLDTEQDTSCDESSPIFRRTRSNKDVCDPETLKEIENHVK